MVEKCVRCRLLLVRVFACVYQRYYAQHAYKWPTEPNSFQSRRTCSTQFMFISFNANFFVVVVSFSPFLANGFHHSVQWSRNGKHSSKPTSMSRPPTVTCCVFSALVSQLKTLCHNAKHATHNTHKYVQSARRCATSSPVMWPAPIWRKSSTNFFPIQSPRTSKRHARASTHCTTYTSVKWVSVLTF